MSGAPEAASKSPRVRAMTALARSRAGLPLSPSGQGVSIDEPINAS
jgi:hypothetical protein